jgi:hypothetical protein
MQRELRVLIFSHWNVGEINNTELANAFFDNMAEFRCSGTTPGKMKYYHEEMKRR